MDVKAYLLVGVAFAVLTAGCTAGQQASGEDGRAVFTVTDAAADMGAVSEVRVTVDRVRVHSEAEGWTTVSSSSETYDLLELKASNTQKLFADADIDAGEYTKLWLDISNVVVVDGEGEHDATLPSGTLRMQSDFVVEPNTTATATFDFVADESLHVTGNGEYIMAPVVRVETRSGADVSVDARSNVQVSGGRTVTDVTVGMDGDGNVGVGVRLPAQANLSLGAQGGVQIGGGGVEGGGSAEAGANVTVG